MTGHNLIVRAQAVREGAILPKYGSDGAAGADLHAWVEGDGHIDLHPGDDPILIPTGIMLDMTQTPLLYARIYPRSSTGHKLGLVLGNGTGIIDNDYQGELMISAFNRGNGTIIVRNGDRIAQLVFGFTPRVYFDKVDSFTTRTARGSGGFGSTGMNAKIVEAGQTGIAGRA